MPIDSACPNCGARDTRVSRSRGWKEKVFQFFGVYQLRCRRCQARYPGKIFDVAKVHYARCPRCYRTELSTWSAQYYNPPASVTMKLRLGATPYRCEFCRCNFASFRACKERFSWRKYRGGAHRGTEGATEDRPSIQA